MAFRRQFSSFGRKRRNEAEDRRLAGACSQGSPAAICPRTAGTAGGRLAPRASPQPPTSAHGARGTSGCLRLRQPQHGGLLPAPAPLKIPGCGAAGSPAARGVPPGSPRPWAAQGPARQGRVIAPPRPLLRPWVFARRPSPGAAGRGQAGPLSQGGCPPSPHGDRLSPQSTAQLHGLETGCHLSTSPRLFSQRDGGNLAQKVPDWPPKGRSPYSHAPRPRVSRVLRNHSAPRPLRAPRAAGGERARTRRESSNPARSAKPPTRQPPGKQIPLLQVLLI